MLQVFDRQRRGRTHVEGLAVASAPGRERDRLSRLSVLSDPRRHRSGKRRRLEPVDEVDAGCRRRHELQILEWTRSDLRNERAHLEIDRLGRSHHLHQAVVPAQHPEQRHIRIVADAKEIGSRPVGRRDRGAPLRVRQCDVRIADRSFCGAHVAQRDDVALADTELTLIESQAERSL